MYYLLKPLNFIADSILAWFTPGWRRRGNEARAALQRYYNYNKKSLTTERAEQITHLVEELKAALLVWDKEQIKKLTDKAKSMGEGLQGFQRNSGLELVESFFVIMVVFLGIRTYYFQPFRIPTGSMQPSLNGIIIHPLEDGQIPSAPKRWMDAITLGSSYVDITIDSPKAIALTPKGEYDIKQEPYLMIFTRSVIRFTDGTTVTIPCARGELTNYLKNTGKLGRVLQPGEKLICARIDAGDMVIVNRMAYHFRKPERGETFVFDTRGINTNMAPEMPDQSNASHYIKRLCGIPGDTLEIQSPQLIVNGAPAQEATITRVAKGEAPYDDKGYHYPDSPKPTGDPFIDIAALHGYSKLAFSLVKPTLHLSNAPDNPNVREYAALGDNTGNSQDSRYWGTVHQFNVLGPAVFTLWPFTNHWGTID